MKRAVIAMLLVLIIVISVAGVAGARSQPGITSNPERIKTIRLMFDGYCDGMTLNFDPLTGIMYGVYGSSCASCPYTDLLGGTQGAAKLQGPGFTVALQGIDGVSPPWIWSRINMSHTWVHYNFDGTVFNSGTWSFCGAEGQAGTAPSTSR